MRRRGKIVVGAFWINLLLLLLFLAGLWGIGLVRFVGDIPVQVEDTTTKTDAIVVLTGGSGRVNEGLALLDKDLAAKLFVSGVYRGLDVRKLLQLARRNPRIWRLASASVMPWIPSRTPRKPPLGRYAIAFLRCVW